MKDNLTKKCKRCGNFLLGLERKGNVCNKCLSRDDSGSMALPWAIAGIAVYCVWHLIASGVFQALTALQAGR